MAPSRRKDGDKIYDGASQNGSARPACRARSDDGRIRRLAYANPVQNRNRRGTSRHTEIGRTLRHLPHGPIHRLRRRCASVPAACLVQQCGRAGHRFRTVHDHSQRPGRRDRRRLPVPIHAGRVLAGRQCRQSGGRLGVSAGDAVPFPRSPTGRRLRITGHALAAGTGLPGHVE